jgi:diguanylate cyclase
VTVAPAGLSASSGRGSGRRRWQAWALALVAVTVAAQLGPIHLQLIVSWASQALLYGVLYVQVTALSRVRELPQATRRFWQILRLTAIAGTLGPLYELGVTLASHGSTGAITDLVHGVFSVASVAIIVWACLTYRWDDDNSRRQLRRWLDAATTMVAGVGVLWYFEAGPLFAAHAAPGAVAAAVLVDAVAMVSVLSFLQPITSDVRPVTTRTGYFVIATVVIGCVTEAGIPPALGTSALGFVLIGRVLTSALAVVLCTYQRQHMHEPSRPAVRSRRLFSLLPYAAVLITYALLATSLALSGEVDGRIWGMFAAATAVTALVVLRQSTAFTDNARLVRDLVASVGTADRLADELLQHAYYDDLTGLSNRVLFGERLERALLARETTGRESAVMVVDLDDFKLVNDRFGHAEGDRVLQEAAARLTGCVRDSDTVARLGGDEFAVLLAGTDSVRVTSIAGRIIAAFERPFLVQENVVELGVSVGLTITNDDPRDTATLLRHADIAMYEAKGAGKHQFAEFSPSMQSSLVGRHDTRQALSGAVANGELVVHYQPIVDARSGRVSGLEALVRWDRPGHGMVPPLEFLGLAEQLGLIADIDLHVLRMSCDQLLLWNSRRDPTSQLSVNVNVSAITLADPEAAAQLGVALRESSLDVHCVTLELTESAFMTDPTAIIARIGDLKETGARLAIDDFGTGYSSLAYLRDLPVDSIKVDKSFIDRIAAQDVDRELVRTIVTLAGRLGLDTVAEGVETAEQAGLLAGMGCARMQGYLFSRPVRAEQVEAAIAAIDQNTEWLAQAAEVDSATVLFSSPR